MNIRNISSNYSKKRIFLLSIPVFLSNLAIPLVGIIDTGLMGNLGEVKYLAATSISTSVMTMLIWSFGFLRMGTVGVVANLYSKSDYREINRTLLRNFLLAIFISIIIILFKNNLIQLIESYFISSLESQELIKKYISIRVFSIPAEFAIYILVGFYLGIQKTNISSLIVIILSTVNIIFSSFFVLSLNLNIVGVVLGTLISSYCTAIIFIFYTYKFISKNFQITPSFNKIIVPSKLVKLLTINIDIFIRTILLTFSFLWFTYLGSKIGEDILAANAILIQFIVFASFFLDAYAYSSEGIVGYAVGRKNLKAFTSTVNNSIQLSFFTSLFISAIFIIFFKDMINIITDIDLIRFISYKYFFWIIIIPPVASLCYQLDGIFIGASQTKDLRNAMIIAVIFYIIISIYSTKYFNNHGLWLSLFIFMILRSLTLNLFLKKITKRL